MPSTNAMSIRSSFERQVQRLKRARDVGEDAFSKAMLGEREVVLLYEVTFLNIVASFEAFQERLFFSCILRDAGLSAVQSLYTFRNRKQAESLVQSTERTPFLSWTKPQQSVTRAKTFLAAGRPFSRLDRRERDSKLILDAVVVRNAIAHQSGPAWREFLKLKGSLAVRRPGEYLRLLAGAETQHESFSNSLIRISRALCANSDVAARRYLLAERHYRSGERVRGGQFRCIDCGDVSTIGPGIHSLPHCNNCRSAPCGTCGAWGHSRFERV